MHNFYDQPSTLTFVEVSFIRSTFLVQGLEESGSIYFNNCTFYQTLIHILSPNSLDQKDTSIAITSKTQFQISGSVFQQSDLKITESTGL